MAVFGKYLGEILFVTSIFLLLLNNLFKKYRLNRINKSGKNEANSLINLLLAELNINADKYNEDAINETEKVLLLLKKELQMKFYIDERVLRAMHDIGMAGYKDFENSVVEVLINKLIGVLGNNIPVYRSLEPLRGEFGKGNPI